MDASLVKPGPHSRTVFYNDLSDQEADKWVKKLRPHALLAFMTPIQYSANDLQCPHWYLMCEKDEAVKSASQERMVGMVKSMRIEKLPTGHSPMLSNPDAFVKILDKVATS
ncbi:uncharacterized protein LY89DRAFT_672949 [Mollisia scopiformis]|uniref:AB hydrolase-1 domain-containing protein n=1 Tax=Mollisia scopiformis TaxID=149040 RepID=A0A194WXX8_MOLSC|nr:uncharacterized protein LY89DRAFT_672949 [Mollisia scopiformis]KUJ12828.1 hypothetical protein LY89DRAFT_672949 [Mollisia scopiformis]